MGRKFFALIAVGGLVTTVGLGVASTNARAGHGHGGYEYDDDDACGWCGRSCGSWASCGWCGGSSCAGYYGCSGSGPMYCGCGGYSSYGYGGYSSCGYPSSGSWGTSGYGYGHGHTGYREYMFTVLGYGLPAYRYMFPAYSGLAPYPGAAPYAGYGAAPGYWNGGSVYGRISQASPTASAYHVAGATTGAAAPTVRDGIPEVRLSAH